jgi:hypothetical protein
MRRADEMGMLGAKLQWPNYQNNPSNIVFRRHGNFIEKDDYRKEGIAL